MKFLYALTTILVLIIIYLVVSNNNKPYEDYLHGFWVAEDIFCKNSEIDSMMLYIGEPSEDSNFWNTERDAFIIIMNNISDQNMSIKYRPGFAPIGVGKYKINADVKFEEEQLWPECVDICVDIKNATMTICHDDVVYAKLIKNFEITDFIGVEKN